MKKFLALLVLIVILSLTIFTFVGCTREKDDRLQIVVTIFPEYDWVMNILGDKADGANVTLLLDSGADLHSFQPSFADKAAISKADLFIYVGGESEEKWVEGALKDAQNKERHTMNLLELLGDKALEEEIVEGMEHEEEEDEHAEEKESDEHVWLSLKNAAYFVDLIAKELATIDGENAATYTENAKKYVAELNALDLRYQETVSAAPRKTLLFGDRFPFRYLVADYGLDYYAAFVGCSAETAASPATIKFLIDKANELQIKVILKIESSTEDIAKTIRDGSNAKNQGIEVLDSLQASTKKEYAEGRTYLAVMTSNLAVLERALAA